MTIAILGPEGTFSHECAEAVRGGEDLIFCRTIREVFERVMSGVADGIVPIENSSAGGVGETLDGLIRYDLRICAEYLLPIRYVFAAQNQGDVPERVYAHPQAHEQCLNFLEECGCPVIHTASNAGSAHRAAEDPESCAVTTDGSRALRSCHSEPGAGRYGCQYHPVHPHQPGAASLCCTVEVQYSYRPP